MRKEYSYELLTKKIRKVKQILASLQKQEQKEPKLFRAYRRKLQVYEEKIKTAKKEKALERDDDQSSVMTGDLSIDMPIESKDAVGDDKKEEAAMDYPQLKKKYKKLKKILKDLEKEHGTKKAMKTKDYAKYKKRGKSLLKQIKQFEDHPEKKEPNETVQKRRPTLEDERKAAIARAEKEADDEESDQRKLVEIERFNAQAELELKKAEALERIHKQRLEREETERLANEVEQIRLQESNCVIVEELSQIDRELAARAAEFKASLEEQEQLGMIRLKRDGDDDEPKRAVSKGKADSDDDDSSFSSVSDVSVSDSDSVSS